MDESELARLRESSGLVLDAEGDWWQGGDRLEHARTLAALHRGLHRAPDGRWAVRIGREWAYVLVKDAAYFVREIAVDDASGLLWGTLRLDEREPFEAASLSLGADDILYVRRPSGERARLTRAAQLSLAERLREHEGKFVLAVGAQLVPIGVDRGP